jgi:hypothetical protein
MRPKANKKNRIGLIPIPTRSGKNLLLLAHGSKILACTVAGIIEMSHATAVINVSVHPKKDIAPPAK